jgi:tRNA(fMet)-specific endonuclease VapC
MTIRYLVDTDWVIHYLHGNPDIVCRLDVLVSQGLGLSVISLAELYEGIYYSTDPQGNERALNDFLRGCAVIGIDAGVCQAFGKERGRLRAAGKTGSDFDLIIGCTALLHDVPLLTNNRRHFELIEGLQVISL